MSTQKSPKNTKKHAIKFTTILKYVFLVILVGIFLVGGAATGYVTSLVKDEPIRDDDTIRNKVFKNNLTGFAYFANTNESGTNELIGTLRADEDRRFIPYSEIPQHVIDAFLAVEDREFWNHYGINAKALTRAVLQQILHSDVTTGGSTITQQLAKNAFFSPEKTYKRKAQEIFLALRMERILTKEEIFTAYINKIPFGKAANLNNVYGIQAAARGYFNKDAKDLNLPESAFLAGIPQRPTAYSSFNSNGFDEEGYALAKKRQELVLKRMLEEGFITQQAYEEALAYDIKAAFDTSQVAQKAYNKYPYLMLEIENRAAERLVESLGITTESTNYSSELENIKQELLTGGYKVYTTINREIYETMNSVVKNPDNFNKPIDYTFTLQNGEKLELHDQLEQVGATLIDNDTGAILGFVGGRDFNLSQVNHSNFRGTSNRQPGSSIKPLLDYAPALELGKIQPATPIDDIPLGDKWEPENWNHKYNGRLTARQALNMSYNIPAVKVYKMVGQEEGYNFYTKLGFEIDKTFFIQAGLTPAIGTLETSPEQMANAYTTFANGGTYVDAYMIEKIVDNDGNVVYEHKPQPRVVFSEQTSYLITDMLRTVVTNGTGTTVRKYVGYNRDIAGKTGTTNGQKDLWFIGYTPEITLSTWVGYPYPHYIKDGLIAKKTWGRIFEAVTKTKPDLSPIDSVFKRPDGLVLMQVSSTSGKLPSDLTREAGYLVTDWFNKKFIPTEVDDSLEKARVITFNDKRFLAKPETPDDMVQTGIFFKREPYELPPKTNSYGGIIRDANGQPVKKDPPVDYQKELPHEVDPRTSTGQPPSRPASPKIELQGNQNVLSWNKVTEDQVVGYRVYRASFGTGFTRIGSIQQTNTKPERLTFTDPVDSSKEFVYYIAAVDVANVESAPSEYIGNISYLFQYQDSEDGQNGDPSDDMNQGQPGTDDGITDGNNDTETPDDDNNQNASAKPSQPANLHAKIHVTGLKVELTWEANPAEDQVTQYKIYYRDSEDGEYKLIGTTSTTSYNHRSVPINKAYYYITAVNQQGESDPSETITVSLSSNN